MKILSVPYQNLETASPSLVPVNLINEEPWSGSEVLSCQAGFSLSHFGQGICLTYTVTEAFLNAKKRRINGAVHRDNCVEFFLGFENEKEYYNFEFNCLGSIKGAFGEGRNRRKFLPPQLLKPVQDNMGISIENHGEQIKWVLTIVLPVSTFLFHQIKSFSGLTCSANFAKCGDDLPNPHFLSWAKIISVTPNFHQPASFGKLIFESNDAAL